MLRAVDIIRKKRDGQALQRVEIETFVHGAVHGTWPDYQLASLLMAIFWRGMNPEETADLTRAMTHSGHRLDWSDLPGPKVDKHSTGGVGDKTSLVLAPLAACCGVLVPMMSGRGLGHSGGTLDKLAAISGFRSQLSVAEMRLALRQVGCVLIGQTADIAPADRRLYALRDVTATVESIPLITASILSKKLAEGISGLVLDVKAGQGAFMKTRDNALSLARSLIAGGQANGMRTEALITAMDAPLGRAVGNALEVKEAIEVLQGAGPADVELLSVILAARMLMVGDMTVSFEDEGHAEAMIRKALSSGQGLAKFQQIIAQQGGDPRVVDDVKLLPRAPHQFLLRAERTGYVTGINAEKIGLAAMHLGAGRAHVDDIIDPSVGCVIQAGPGTIVRSGDVLVEVHYRAEDRLAVATPLFRQAWSIGDEAPAAGQFIMKQL
jgi:pyrimidine-nucleoside phosphorylase